MAIKLDLSILDEVGLGELPDDEKKVLFQTFVERLELNVGTQLSANMTTEQTDQFMEKVNAGDQEGARQWLEDNAPDYKDVVAKELEKLKSAFAEEAKQILDHLESEES